MKILIDMNLSPDWVKEFKANSIDAVHWSEVGKFDAPDAAIITWAREIALLFLRTILILALPWH